MCLLACAFCRFVSIDGDFLKKGAGAGQERRRRINMNIYMNGEKESILWIIMPSRSSTFTSIYMYYIYPELKIRNCRSGTGKGAGPL